jgi:hypothetical protein
VKYPDAKFILTTRDADKWYESAYDTIYKFSKVSSYEFMALSAPYFHADDVCGAGSRGVQHGAHYRCTHPHCPCLSHLPNTIRTHNPQSSCSPYRVPTASTSQQLRMHACMHTCTPAQSQPSSPPPPTPPRPPPHSRSARPPRPPSTPPAPPPNPTLQIPVTWYTRPLMGIAAHVGMVRRMFWQHPDVFADSFAENPQAAKAWFEGHNKRVLETVPADRLLVFNVTQGWAPLCKFLGKPVPDEPFPNANERTILRRVGLMFRVQGTVLQYGIPLGLLAALAWLAGKAGLDLGPLSQLLGGSGGGEL